MKKQEAKSKTMEGVSGGRTGVGSGVIGGRTGDGSGDVSDVSGGRSGNESESQGNYRNKRVTVRLTEGEFELVMRLAKRGNVVHGSGCTVSDVLRGLIFSSLSSLLVLLDGGMAERLVKSVTGNALRNGGDALRNSGTESKSRTVENRSKIRCGEDDDEVDGIADVGLEVLDLFKECEQDGKEREWPGNVRERR
jgi:hypothetical protein